MAAEPNTAVADREARRTGGEPDGNVAQPPTREKAPATKPRPKRKRRRSKRIGATATTEPVGEKSRGPHRPQAEAVAPSPAADSESSEPPADSATAAEKGVQPPTRPGRRRRRSRSRRVDSSVSSTDEEAQEARPTSESADVKQPVAAPRGRTASRKKAAPSRSGSSARPAERSKVAKESPKPQPRQRTRKPAAPSTDRSGRIMLINAATPDECRIAVLHDGELEELFLERQSSESHVGNIYKGRVLNIEPSIQAAFIDFGLPRNGFLHITDVQPQYFPGDEAQSERVGKKVPRHDRPPIQKCLRRGQDVIVQVIKEGVGTKGPTLTTYLSMPGKYMVMMPGMNQLGVSRKIEDPDIRRSMRQVLGELDLPEGMGFIMRTAGEGCLKRELQRDLNYLKRLWKVVADRIRSQDTPCELYQESDLVIRTIRDVYTPEFDRIVVDNEETAAKIREFLRIAMPRSASEVVYHDDPEPLFHKYRVEQELDRINSRDVALPSGGSLVIESTEAMVTIDVNSGRFRETRNAEETAYRINMEAAKEISRQLRLRDLGGLIVCDFIDMVVDSHKRDVERTLREGLKKHKERARILRMSQFGIIEMTRQRQRRSIKGTLYRECPHCGGSGHVKALESVTIDAMRTLQMAAHRQDAHRVVLSASPDVAMLMQNQKRAELLALEQATGTAIIIRGEQSYATEEIAFVCEDERGRPLKAGS